MLSEDREGAPAIPQMERDDYVPTLGRVCRVGFVWIVPPLVRNSRPTALVTSVPLSWEPVKQVVEEC